MDKTPAQDLQTAPAPVLWLLGKTGAGKTSVIRALTGEGVLGSGWAPGTNAAALFDFPAMGAAVRFLDTRGFGEAGIRTGARSGDGAQAIGRGGAGGDAAG